MKLLFTLLFLFLGNAFAQTTEHNAYTMAEKLVRKIGIDGGSGKCNQCHGASIMQAKAWSKQSTKLEYVCLKKEGLTPIERVNCFRTNPLDPSSPFTASSLGFYSLHTRSDVFAKLFADAYPENPGEARKAHEALIDSASMPPVGTGISPFADDEAKEIMVWANNSMPLVDAVVKPDEEKPCSPFISTELKSHLLDMKLFGWTAKNEGLGMNNFGCGLSTDPLQCFPKETEITNNFGAPGVAQTIRNLHDRGQRSYYWFRASPDGRYMGFGGSYGSKINFGEIVDLKAFKQGKESSVSFEDATDPHFLPDGSGFVFTGLEKPNQSVCKIGFIDDGLKKPGTRFKLMDQQKCTTVTEGWYDSWGASLDGSGYWMVAGNFIADDAQYSEANPIPANSNYRTDIIRLNEMINDGLAYRPGRAAAMSVKGLVDMMVSPSAKIMNNRFGANGVQSGFQIRTIDPKFDDEGGSLHFKKVGEFCGFGGKANFSFDERFVTFHQYPEPWRAGEPKLPAGVANIVVIDLLTGVSTRITNVPAGYKALFPHFRSDGWLYFVLRDPSDAKESIVASDFAIRSTLVPIPYGN